MNTLKKITSRALFWDLAGTVLTQSTNFIISIFLARLLEPEEFGLVGMAWVFISIFQVFIDVGFSSALIQNKTNTSLIYSSVFYLNFMAGLFLTLIFFFASPLIGQFYENPEITTLVRWLSLIFLINSLNRVQKTILTRELKLKQLTLRSLASSLLGGVVGVTCAFEGWGVYSLVASQLVGALVGVMLIWTTSEWRPDRNFSMHEVRKLLGFSSFVFLDRFLSALFQRLDMIFVGKIFSPATLGFYSRAVTLKDQVVTYSSASLTKIFFPVLSKLQDDDDEFNRIYFKVISVISLLSYGLSGLLYILGPDIITGLFGQKWTPSIEIFQVLIISVCNFPLNSMMVSAFMSKGKSKENFIIGIFRKLVRVTPLFFGYFYGLYSFTVAIVFTSYFLTLANIYFLNKTTGLPASRHFRKIFEGIIPLGVTIGVFNLLNFQTLFLRLLLALGYIIVYMLYNYAIKSEGFLFVMYNSSGIIKKYLNKER